MNQLTVSSLHHTGRCQGGGGSLLQSMGNSHPHDHCCLIAVSLSCWGVWSKKSPFWIMASLKQYWTIWKISTLPSECCLSWGKIGHSFRERIQEMGNLPLGWWNPSPTYLLRVNLEWQIQGNYRSTSLHVVPLPPVNGIKRQFPSCTTWLHPRGKHAPKWI